jgi:hypothetical protein
VVVDAGWSRLPEHWCGAFRQAWAAYAAGTIPVGAVVVDPQGVIAAEARNRIFDAGDPPRGQLAGSWLAHAELNAIAQIDAERSRTAEGWAVYSTWEPCPLCAGAITVAFRRAHHGGIRLSRRNQQRAARADGHRHRAPSSVAGPGAARAVRGLRRVAPGCLHCRGASDEPHRCALPRATLAAAHQGARPRRRRRTGRGDELGSHCASPGGAADLTPRRLTRCPKTSSRRAR